MADVNKTVEISLKANLKQLEDGLKRLPGMTEKEARKMVQALSQELKKTQREAKKTASVSRAATTKMSQGFDQAALSARRARKQSRDMGAALGSLEDVVGALNPELATMAAEIGIAGQALRTLSRSLATSNPILMGLVAGLALAATAYTIFTSESRKTREEFKKTMKEAEETAKAIEKLTQQSKALSEQFSLLAFNPMLGSLATFEEIGEVAHELELVTGKITKNQYERERLSSEIYQRGRDISKEYHNQLKVLNEQKKLDEDALTISKKLMMDLGVRLDLARKERNLTQGEMSDLRSKYQIEQERVRQIEERLKKNKENQQLLIEESSKATDRAKELAGLEKQLLEAKIQQERREKAIAAAQERSQKVQELSTELNKEMTSIQEKNEALRVSMLSKEEQIKDSAQKRRDLAEDNLEKLRATVDQLTVTAKTEEELLYLEQAREDLADAELATAKQKELITAQEKTQLDALVKKGEEKLSIEKQLTNLSRMRSGLEKSILDMTLESIALSDPKYAAEARLVMAKDELINKINQESDALLEKAKTQEEIDLIEEERRKTMRAAEEEHVLKMDELRDQLHKKQLNQTFEASKVFLQGIGDIANSSLALLEQVGSKNKTLVSALFFAQKAVALSEIVFNTAKAITAAPATFGAFAPIAIAGYVATAAAQSANVMAQKPPKFHMGGMMENTPDERVVIVKSGEAILDRATVNQLGGSQGMRNLRNGDTPSPQVIVMNPYKHFDRFMTDRERQGFSAVRARRGY